MQLRRLDSTATAQHGVCRLAVSGLSNSSRYHAIESGHFDQPHTGVAHVPGTPDDTPRNGSWAAVLACRAGGAHLAPFAAHLWAISARPTIRST